MWVNSAITSANGEVEEMQGIGRDITDRWRAEEALRLKEASLREAYERIKSLAHRLILAQEAERGLRTLVTLLEPALIVAFGGLVAFVAAALLQAVYSVRPM